MNDQHDGSELPDLSDDDVRLLYAICQRAGGSRYPPFKALFSAYDAILREEDIEQEHDGVIFRALLRVGESTVEANKKRQHVDLVERLEDVLEARGITLIREDGHDEYTGTTTRTEQPQRPTRRVSFDDARLEETWLSEHSEAVNPRPPPPQGPHSLLSLPPRRSGHRADTGRRARSTSSQRSIRRPVPKSFQTSSSHDQHSEESIPQHSTLHFEVSQTQLEMNADAMLGIAEVRLQRRTLHFLHDQSLQLQAAREQSSAIAVAHDHRILLKQAMETWRGATLEQRYERRHDQHFQHLERKAERARNLFLITKAFTHWATQCSDERFRTRIAQHYVLRAKYFKRWRNIAVENQTKIRSVLCRKYISIWREKTARQSLSEEYAQAWHEERLTRRCKLSMFWEFCSRQVASNHDEWIKRRALSSMRNVLQARVERNVQAERRAEECRAQRSLRTLYGILDRCRQASEVAVAHHSRAVSSKAVHSISAHARLTPLYRNYNLKRDSDLARKTLRLLQHCCHLGQQATAVRRKMLLLNASVSLSDDYRCTLVARIDEDRVKALTMRRLTIGVRLSKWQRSCNRKLASRSLSTWQAKVSQGRNQIEYAQAVLAEAQQRRLKHAAFHRLNLAMRQREDAARAAVEFRNSRHVPQVFDWMRREHEHMQRLESWAQMALFYRLSTRTLRVWHERATENKANRRRNAYTRVRARIKIRLAGSCLARWHAQAMDRRSMSQEAERRAAARVVNIKVDVLARWRERTTTAAQLQMQATLIDEDRLLRSALSELRVHTADKIALKQRLDQSNRATDLALLASALRRLLWESFKAARNHESAEALRLRNRDTHAKQMLRHWALQAATKRLPAPDVVGTRVEEPESPSLRPASRAASRASAAGTPVTTLPSSPPQRSVVGLVESTPGYMRTPSRSRRAGRFRPIPTPAPVTPFNFDPAYLTTTPAPLAAGGVGQEGLTPQVTPFARKLRAGGFGAAAPALPPSALRSSVFGGGGGAGTGKSVRFAGSGGRFGKGSLKRS